MRWDIGEEEEEEEEEDDGEEEDRVEDGDITGLASLCVLGCRVV